jgi:TRAP-type mannitol/chloroaromatic compound transport system permease small subunit
LVEIRRIGENGVPTLNFVMPHWLYWSGLLLFPLFAMYMVRRVKRGQGGSVASLPVAYLFLITGGFIGLHRFYLKSLLGVIYIPLFCGILFANVQFREARDVGSRVNQDVRTAEFMVKRAQRDIARSRSGATARLEKARRDVEIVKLRVAGPQQSMKNWDLTAFWLGVAIAVLVVFDFFRLPALARSLPPDPAASTEIRAPPVTEGIVGDGGASSGASIFPGFTRTIEKVNDWTGNFIAYWSIIAVFVYYYEVLARYVFNSPTNWAHESMFLMFGMQYLLAGGYALRENAHVRVDIIYTHFSPRGKAICDLITSVLFFIFATTLLWTGWIFAGDAIEVLEVSFTEWAIQYWPVKMMIALGALLLLLQGMSNLFKDVATLSGRGA